MKNAKKVIEGNADTIRRQTIRQNLPRTASVAGGGETKKSLWQDQPPSKPSRVSSAWRGRRDEEGRIEGQHRREDKENQSQNPPAGYHRGGGGDKRRKPTQNGKVAQPTVPGGGRCLAENAYQKRKQNNVHHKGNKTKHTVLCHCVRSQITLAAPRLGAEEGVGKTTKKTNTIFFCRPAVDAIL